MENSFGNFEYKNNVGEKVDFEKKRFQFWLETVPEDVRRLEFELSKRYRKLLHASLYKMDNKQMHGRFVSFPEFDKKAEDDMWDEFKGSFLKGAEKSEAFGAIVDSVKKNVSNVISGSGFSVDDEKIKLIALGGSNFYGPRRAGERLSDVDLYVLFEESSSDLNFEVFPVLNDVEKGNTQYHVMGTGNSDESRGEKRLIHWLLYPHMPIINRLSDDELRSMISKIATDTRGREDQIKKNIEDMDGKFERLRGSEIREDHGSYN